MMDHKHSWKYFIYKETPWMMFISCAQCNIHHPLCRCLKCEQERGDG